MNEILLVVLVVLSFTLAYLSWKYVEAPFRKKGRVSRKAVFVFAMIGSLAFISIGIAGRRTNGWSTQRGLTLQALGEKNRVNRGLSNTCEGSFTLSPDCRTSDEPTILIWGDSFAMHLVPGILASNPDARIIQMTKSVCGPFFDVAPVIKPKNLIPWAKGCLDFTGKVREWLKEKPSIKYAVLSSPFGQYISKENSLLFRDGDVVGASFDLAVIEFKKTLSELETMGIIPIVFSPPPTNGVNLGRCLVRAELFGGSLDLCDFLVDEIPPDHLKVFRFLEAIKGNYRVVRLDHFICNSLLCKTHLGSTHMYRDTIHLSHEGSALLGKNHDFYSLISGNDSE